jgi:hypothetical protein
LTAPRIELRAAGLELRLGEPGEEAAPARDLLDPLSWLGATRTTVRVRAPFRGVRDGDHLSVPIPGEPDAALPDRGELELEVGLSTHEGVTVLSRLELSVSPTPVRVAAGDGNVHAVVAALAGEPWTGVRLEAVDGSRGRLHVETVGAGEAAAIETDLRLPGSREPLALDLLLGLLEYIDGGEIVLDGGPAGKLKAALDGPVGNAAGEGVLELPSTALEVELPEGRYRFGALPVPPVRGPVRLRARLGPSQLPRETGPGRAAGQIDCTDLDVEGLVEVPGGEARVDLRGRGRLLVRRVGGKTALGLSGVVLRSEGLRIGLEGELGRDVRLDLTASPVSLTLGWLGAELALAAERLVAPGAVLGSGMLRLDQAVRCEQLRISFRSPLVTGGLSASGAAAMEELEARGEIGRGVLELEPLRILGLRPSLSLVFERAGSAAEAALSLGGLLAGHTSLEGTLRTMGEDVVLTVRAGDADEGVRLEGGEIELHTPGLEARAVFETGPLQPERIELRLSDGGLLVQTRFGRTLFGLREFASEVAGVETAFGGEATGELSGFELAADAQRLRVSTAGSGLALRLLGEGLLRVGETTIRLDRERATTFRLRGEVVREADGEVHARIDGGEVRARIGRSEHHRPA